MRSRELGKEGSSQRDGAAGALQRLDARFLRAPPAQLIRPEGSPAHDWWKALPPAAATLAT